MIERKRLLSMGYYKKADSFTGSDGNKNYKIQRIKLEESDELRLQAIVWPGPLCLEKTDDSLKVTSDAEFSEEGLLELTDWMNSVSVDQGDL